MSRFSFILTAFQNIIQVNKISAKVNISIVLHFIKIVAPLTVFVTINSTRSHIYRDICSGSIHCYNTTQWYWALRCWFQHVFLTPFFCSFRRKLLTIWLNGDARMWKAVSCAKVEQNIFFSFCFEQKIKEQSAQMMHDETVWRQRLQPGNLIFCHFLPLNTIHTRLKAPKPSVL